MESSKKVQDSQFKQKQLVNAASASRSTTMDSKSSTTLVSSTSVKRGSTSSKEASWDSASKTSTTVTKQGRNGDRRNESAVSVAQNRHAKSENGEMVNKKSRESTVKPSATANRLSSNVSVVDAGASSQPAASSEMPGGNRRLSDVNEPTKQPVAARLAAWKKKTAATENVSSTSRQRSASREKLQTISEAGGIHRHVTNDKDSHVDVVEPKTIMSSCASAGKASVSVPVTRGTSDDSGKTSFPPLKDGEVRQRTLPRKVSPTTPRAAQPSWKKLGPATLEIQQKLTAMCENWKRNEITEKSRKERAEDLVVLENRWRNGILAEEQTDVVAAAVHVPSAKSDCTSHSQVY